MTTSPQANAEPAPLANVAAAASVASPGAFGVDGGARPETLRADRPLAADAPRETVRELVREPKSDAGVQRAKEPVRDPKELAGYEMQAVIHTGEGPPPPKAPEVNAAGIEAARRKTEARMTIDASQTRARFVLSGGFALPPGTELRARADRYGSLLFWPGQDAYRVVEPGALRALFGERRLDVAPVSHVDVVPQGEGARRLDLRTRRVELTTRAAKATLELATLREAGEGGSLVCRMLLDLVAAAPAASPCATDEVPLHAELRWTTQGALVFDVTSIARKVDLAVQDMAAPPSSAPFSPDPPPVPPGEPLLSKADLTGLRTAPIDAPPPTADARAPLPASGLLLVNATDELRVAWIDGVEAAWVAPGATLLLPSLLRGRYAVQWRTFLGDDWEAPRTVLVPGRSEVGETESPPK